MAYNASYFVDTLPDLFDSWNASIKYDYYAFYLWGFLSLSDPTQSFIVQYLDESDIKNIWNATIHDESFATAQSDGYNASSWFLMQLESVYQEYGVQSPTPESPCATVNDEEKWFYIFYVLPAFFVAFLFSFCKQRRRLCHSCCWQKPSIAYPVNFVDEHSRRWAFAAGFAVITHRILRLLEGDYIWQPDQFQDAEWMKQYGWVKIFVGFLNVLIVGTVYFPLLAALNYRRHIAANILGILLIVPYVWLIQQMLTVCPVNVGEGELKDLSEAQLDERINSILQVCFDVPRIICYAILLIAYILDLVKNILMWMNRNKLDQKPKTELPLPLQYLKYRLRKKETIKPEGFIQRIRYCCTYEPVPGFKYSTRIMCTMAVGLYALYKVAIEIEVLIITYYPSIKELVKVADELQLFNENNTYIYQAIVEGVDVLYVSLTLCNILSFVIHVLFIVHMLISYRKHMLKMYQGNHRWYFKYVPNAANDMVASFRYSGYQIAYLFYGFIITLVILVLICLLIAFGIVLPLKIGYASAIIDQIIQLWPTIVLSFVLLWTQVLVSKFVFLYDKGAYMALNNRRLFHLLSFYLFFANVLLGIFSCLKRALISLVFGILFISRLDRNLMMRGVERFDTGFKSYLGFLIVDINHNHPIMKAFIIILMEEANVRPRKIECSHSSRQELMVENDDKHAPYNSKKYMWRNKWRKAVTLANNPILVVEKLQDQVRENRRNYSREVQDEIFNQIANVGTVTVAAAGLGAAFSVDAAVSATDVTIL